GGADWLEQWLKAVAPEGQISLVGWLDKSKGASTINMASIAATVVRMHRIAVGSRAQFLAMNRAIGLHRVKPVIDRVFPFDDTVEAFRYYAAGKYFGKIVISQGGVATETAAFIAPSPRLRGEGCSAFQRRRMGEGDFPRALRIESPPHPTEHVEGPATPSPRMRKEGSDTSAEQAS